MSNPKDYLFVYGTLLPGFENQAARLLHESATHLSQGRVRGLLYLIADYPGLVLCDEAEESWVRGDVYVLYSPAQTYEMLDAYEGDVYCRSILPVQVDSGLWIEACVYVYLPAVTGKQRIESGNYLVR